MKTGTFVKRMAAIACAAVALTVESSLAATYYVGTEGGDQASIDAALAAIAANPGADGDEVIVRTGTYTTEAAYVLSSKITVRSATGKPGDVILKGKNKHRLFVLNHADAKVSGVTIQDCVSDNYGGYQGGGVKITSEGGTLEKSVVHSCRADGNGQSGGGVYQEGGLVDCCVISNCVIHREGSGGGLGICVAGSGVARSCLIAENREGGTPFSGSCNEYLGAAKVDGNGKLINCTITDNRSFKCPGVWAASANSKVINCIIAENVSDQWSDLKRLTYVGTASCFSNCVSACPINDKCFVMEHPFQNFAARDFSPIIGSAGVDTGAAEDWMATATDLLGNPRKSGTKPDVGAIERDHSSLCANFSASPSFGTAPLTVTFKPTVGGASGTVTYDWDFNGDGVADSHDAQPVVTFNDVAHHPVMLTVKDGTRTFTTPYAVPVKVFGEEIRVVKNNPNAAPPYDTWVNAAASLETAYDYAETNTTVVVSNGTYALAKEFRAVKPVTIRSFTGRAEDVILSADNAKGNHRVIQLGHPKAKISGVTIRNGRMPFCFVLGAGVNITSEGGTLEKSIIRDCDSSGRTYKAGGGLYIDAGAANALVDRCVISNCTADCHGSSGGGLAADICGGVVRNCLITENKYSNTDSGISGTVKLEGGRLVNCTVVRNKITHYPGVWATGGLALNCIIAKNESETSTDPSYLTYAGTASCFSNCVGTAAINDTCAAMEDPFVDYAKKDYSIALGTTSVDFGIKEDWMTDALDLAGNARLQGSKPDAGAYEADQSKFAVGFTADSPSGLAPLKVNFTVTAYGAVGELECYWDWDGDGTVDETTKGTTATHEFKESGSSNVKLSVKDLGSGKTCSASQDVPISVLSKYVYVSKTSANPTVPYVGWGTAAHAVEEAIAAAIEGCEIVVSNGTHDITEEVKITKGLTIRGFTGKPEDVVLKAKSGTTHRMFMLSHAEASLVSLTIRDGNSGALSGGGVYIETAGGTVSNCVVHSCKATGNSVPGGGIYVKAGADLGLVDSCVISNCMCHREGDGGGLAIALYGGEARNCLITKNIETDKNGSQQSAGSAKTAGGRLVNCTITGNKSYTCPGVWGKSGSVINCIIAENTCYLAVDAKSSTWAGSESCFANCLGTDAMNGTCHVLEHPFVDSAHGDYTPVLGTAAIDGGETEAWMEKAKDFKGNARISGEKPDIGAIEYQQKGLSVGYSADVASGKAPLAVTFTATVIGKKGTVTYKWDLDGDGTFETTTDNPVLKHTFATPCVVEVALKVVDAGTDPASEKEAEIKTTIRALGARIYVSEKSANPAEPYDSWANAAKDVASAVAVVCDGCEVVVSNGTYDIAAELQLLSGITVRGLTGDFRDVTLKSKAKSGNHRIFRLNHANAKVQDLTLRDAAAPNYASGGGVYIDVNGGTLLRCNVVNCNANNTHAACGGGVYVVSGASDARVESCVFSGCQTHNAGSGAAIYLGSGLAFNCVVSNNASYYPVRVAGGTFANSLVLDNKKCPLNPGVYATSGEVINCIIVGNTTSASAAGAWTGTAACFANCLMDVETLPNGTCVTEAPTDTFRNFEGGNYRLKSTSKGNDGGVSRDWMTTAKDVRGRPRKLGPAPDCGIYEMNAGLSVIVR